MLILYFILFSNLKHLNVILKALLSVADYTMLLPALSVLRGMAPPGAMETVCGLGNSAFTAHPILSVAEDTMLPPALNVPREMEPSGAMATASGQMTSATQVI